MQDVVSEEVAGSTRSRRAVLGALAGGAVALSLAACGSSSDPQTADATASNADAPKGGQDLVIVNYALTLEYIESDLYDQIVGDGVLSGRAADVAKEIQGNEHEHVSALEALARKLGGKPAERPQTHFPLGGGAREALRLAARIEDLGASAYLGQLDQTASREVLAALLSIHSIEARHSAGINRLLGYVITPQGAFGSPQDMSEVMGEVQRYIV